MKTKIGINGFGRIGRQVLKAIKVRTSCPVNTWELHIINTLIDLLENRFQNVPTNQSHVLK